MFISIGLLQFGPVRVYKKHSVEMFSSASEKSSFCLSKTTPKIPKKPSFKPAWTLQGSSLFEWGVHEAAGDREKEAEYLPRLMVKIHRGS